MAITAPWADHAGKITEAHGSSHGTIAYNVVLSAQNYHAQHAGGAAIAWTSGFTQYQTPTRLPQIVLGAGGANPTVYTITGTDIYTGAVITENVTAAGAGTYSATQPYETITAFSSDVDPVGTTDLQANDTWVYPAARWLVVGGAGNVAGRLMEALADATIALPAEPIPFRYQIVRITSTTATGLVLAW
jgi:hypothetical protein